MTIEQVVAVFAGLLVAFMVALIKYVRDFVKNEADHKGVLIQAEIIGLIEIAADRLVLWVEQRFPLLAGNEKFQMVLAKLMEEIPTDIDFEPYIEAAVKRMKERMYGGS